MLAQFLVVKYCPGNKYWWYHRQHCQGCICRFRLCVCIFSQLAIFL